MKILEKTLLILILLAVLGKLVPVPGAGILITCSIFLLCFLYFPFGFALFTKIGFKGIFKSTSYSHLKPWDIIISIVTGLALQTLLMALLFQIQYWPGGNIMAVAGLLSTLPFLIIAAIMSMSKNTYVYAGILTRGLPMFLFVLFLYMTPVTKKLKIFKVSEPEIEARILNDAKEGN